MEKKNCKNHGSLLLTLNTIGDTSIQLQKYKNECKKYYNKHVSIVYWSISEKHKFW